MTSIIPPWERTEELELYVEEAMTAHREGPSDVWECWCGNMTFILRRDGEIKCSNCDTAAQSDGGNWIISA